MAGAGHCLSAVWQIIRSSNLERQRRLRPNTRVLKASRFLINTKSPVFIDQF